MKGQTMIPSSIDRFFARSAIPLTLASATEPDQPLLLANNAFCAMSGYEPSSIVGRNCRLLQGRDTQTEARHEIRAAIREARDLQVTITNYRANGERFENLLFMYALTDDNGRATYFMGSQFEFKENVRQRDLLGHIGELDSGVSRILSATMHTHIKTRRILAEAAAGLVRAKIDLKP